MSQVSDGEEVEAKRDQQEAAFDAILAKVVTAAQLKRHARYVELCCAAVEQAEELYPDSFVAASLRVGQAKALCILADGATGAEALTLYGRALFSGACSCASLLDTSSCHSPSAG